VNHEDTKARRKHGIGFSRWTGTLDPTLEELATQVVDAAYKVHHQMGPGLLEQVYEECLIREFSKRGIPVQRQVQVPLVYDGEPLSSIMRLDLLVADTVILEIKAIESLLPVHEAQLLSYLKLTDKRLGFLINFNVPVIRDGIQRIVL
jgi:GxxExxY protein